MSVTIHTATPEGDLAEEILAEARTAWRPSAKLTGNASVFARMVFMTTASASKELANIEERPLGEIPQPAQLQAVSEGQAGGSPDHSGIPILLGTEVTQEVGAKGLTQPPVQLMNRWRP